MKIKKTLGVMVLAIFILSLLPTALAEKKEGDTKGVGVVNNLKNTGEGLKIKLAKYNQSLGFRARLINNTEIEAAKERFQQAKQKFDEAKDNLKEARDSFKEQLQLAKNACKENATECQEQLKEKAKNFLGKSADAIINHLNKVKAKVEGNEDLSDEESKVMIAQIDAKIAAIQAAQAQAENATTKEEITDAAKEINANWKNTKRLTNAYASEMINAKIGGITVKSEHVKEKLDKILVRMDQNGKNTTDIQPMIDEFNASIQLAKEKYEAAQAKFQEYWNSTDQTVAQQKLQEAQTLMKEARDALKQANEKLKEIIKTIKQNNGNEEIKQENEEYQNENEGNQTEPANETETD